MDSAIAGDVVVAEAGEYLIVTEALHIPHNVSLIGESGPAQTLIHQPNVMGPSYTVIFDGDGLMEGLHVKSATTAVASSASGEIATSIIDGRAEVFQTTLSNCLVMNNSIYTGNSLFVQCILLSYVDHTAGALPTLIACDVVGGVETGIDISPTNGNFSLDPQFCGVSGSSNYYLMSTSPCLPANNPFGIPIMIGPMPQGCSTVSVQERTWGGIKAMYMDRR